jgi:AcrR family transcriptional regulator
MARWAPDAAGRLKASALELFAARGFASVTAAEIAARAGMTERSFFRHFRAKEDVLFADHSGVGEALVAAIAAAPAPARARALMQGVADLLGERFGGQREEHRRLARVVRDEPALRAREALRDHDWARAIARGFERRGFAAPRAALLAAATATTFRVAYDGWLDDASDRTLAARFAQLLETLAADLE